MMLPCILYMNTLTPVRTFTLDELNPIVQYPTSNTAYASTPVFSQCQEPQIGGTAGAHRICLDFPAQRDGLAAAAGGWQASVLDRKSVV